MALSKKKKSSNRKDTKSQKPVKSEKKDSETKSIKNEVLESANSEIKEIAGGGINLKSEEISNRRGRSRTNVDQVNISLCLSEIENLSKKSRKRKLNASKNNGLQCHKESYKIVGEILQNHILMDVFKSKKLKTESVPVIRRGRSSLGPEVKLNVKECMEQLEQLQKKPKLKKTKSISNVTIKKETIESHEPISKKLKIDESLDNLPQPVQTINNTDKEEVLSLETAVDTVESEVSPICLSNLEEKKIDESIDNLPQSVQTINNTGKEDALELLESMEIVLETIENEEGPTCLSNLEEQKINESFDNLPQPIQTINNIAKEVVLGLLESLESYTGTIETEESLTCPTNLEDGEIESETEEDNFIKFSPPEVQIDDNENLLSKVNSPESFTSADVPIEEEVILDKFDPKIIDEEIAKLHNKTLRIVLRDCITSKNYISNLYKYKKGYNIYLGHFFIVTSDNPNSSYIKEDFEKAGYICHDYSSVAKELPKDYLPRLVMKTGLNMYQ